MDANNLPTGWKESRFRLTGVCPLILHNGKLADPLSYFAKEIKKISGKKKKTDADLEQMAKLEWMGGLYVDDQKRIILPTEGMEAILVAGAKKSKEGQTAKSGVYCPAASVLEYNGPKDLEELWDDEKFRLRVGCKVKQATVMRTRPIFPEWSCSVIYCYNTSVIANEEQVYSWLRIAGEQCGAFEWRPKFGRFTAEPEEKKKWKPKAVSDGA